MRRWPITRSVVSATMQKTPPTSAGFDAHRIVRDVEIGVFGEAVALEREEQILAPERLAGADDVGEQPVQHAVPDFTPRVAAGQPERLRMLRAEDGTVGVVVEDDELRAPEQDDLGLRRQQHAERAAQTLRPGVRIAGRRLRPIEGAHARTHFAAAGEERQRRQGPKRRLACSSRPSKRESSEEGVAKSN